MLRLIPICLSLTVGSTAIAAWTPLPQDPPPPSKGSPEQPADASEEATEKSGITEFHFEAETLGGTPITEQRYANSVLVVDLWGTWCPPCREAVPVLVNMYKKYKHQGLEIVGLNYREQGEAVEAADTVRTFAEEHGITYDLAMGSQGVVDQVPDFQGFPTMLFFGRGLEHGKTKVGFKEGDEAEIESWIRVALGLDEAGEVTAEESQRREDQAELKAAKEEDVPEGVIFKPGANDTGFAFSFPTLEGKELEFESLKGRAVLLAITSTWDEEAPTTAALLETVRASVDGASVLGAFYEKSGEAAARLEQIRTFCAAQRVSFTAVDGGLKLVRKVHKMNALPTFLVFDKQGVLVHRAEGIKASTTDELKAALGKAQGQ